MARPVPAASQAARWSGLVVARAAGSEIAGLGGRDVVRAVRDREVGRHLVVAGAYLGVPDGDAAAAIEVAVRGVDRPQRRAAAGALGARGALRSSRPGRAGGPGRARGAGGALGAGGTLGAGRARAAGGTLRAGRAGHAL